MELTEKVIGSKNIFEGVILKLHVDDVELPDGSVSDREIVDHNGGVAVIPVTEDGYVYMVTQYRLAAQQTMLEVPAGKLEKGEDPLECGKRELIEETGYKGNKFTYLGEFFVSPGYCREKINIYLAQDLEWQGQSLDDEEFLNVSKHSLNDLYDMVMNNEINDCKTVIAIMKAKQILNY